MPRSPAALLFLPLLAGGGCGLLSFEEAQDPGAAAGAEVQAVTGRAEPGRAPEAEWGAAPVRAGGAAGPQPPAPREPEVWSEEELDRQTRLALAVLRARGAGAALSRHARVRVSGPRTFGERVPVELVLFNALGGELELRPSDGGLWMELEWRVERWSPYGDRQVGWQRRALRVEGPVVLGPGQAWREQTELPLEASAFEGSALWRVELGVRLRPDGAVLDGEELPLDEVRFQPGEILAFPAGWKPLAADPLASLEQAASLEAPQADRHVLVAAALLRPGQRRQGMETLIRTLETTRHATRARTAVAALAFLAGPVVAEELGLAPARWLAWWEGGGRP